MKKGSFLHAGIASALALGLVTTANAQMTPDQEPPDFPEGEQLPWQTPEDRQAPPEAEQQQPQRVNFDNVTTRSLESARQSFIEEDFERSAMDLRRAAALLEVEARAASGEARRDLARAAGTLERLAQQVERGQVRDIEQLDPALAQAEHALASHYHQLAEEAWERRDTTRAGHALRSSARHLERAATWTGGEAAGIARDVVGDAFRLSGTLVRGAGFVPREVGSAIEGVGRATDRLGQEIHRRPARERAPEFERQVEPRERRY